MDAMSIFTLNGKSYEVADRKARDSITGILNDGVIVKDKTWSSYNILKETADRYCPLFRQTAPIVAGAFVADYPLHVMQHISPTQEGDGDPTPKNVRNFVAIQNSANSIEKQGSPETKDSVTVQFPAPLYGGLWDITDGTLEKTWEIEQMLEAPNEKNISISEDMAIAYIYMSKAGMPESDQANSLCNIAKYAHQYTDLKEFHQYVSGNRILMFIPISALSTPDKAGVKKLFTDQIAKGAPVTFAYKLKTGAPQAAVTPYERLAFDGTTTIYGDTGGVTVEGRESPNGYIGKLQAQIDDLRKAIISTGGNV